MTATLSEIFATTVARFPERVALSAGDLTYTYRELDMRAAATANALAGEGVRPGDLVGVLADRGPSAAIGLLAILRLGAAYVPLDPSHPAERVRFILDDSRVRVVVGPTAGAKALGLGIRLVDPALLAPTSGRVAAASTDDSALAYVIYTSGSTGTPKGCLITHRHVCRFLDAFLQLVEVNEHDVWSVSHSLSFDVSVSELWGAWATGACAVLVDSETAMSPEAFLELLSSRQVTVYSQVPSVFRFLALACHRAPRPLRLRYLLLAGESVDLPTVSSFLADVDQQQGQLLTAINLYGPTETTIYATAKILDSKTLQGQVRSPIGHALPHLTVEVCDPVGRPVEEGVTGEICVSGESIALGYLNRDTLTADRFRTKPTAKGVVREYRTGDLGRKSADGIEYLGRNDDQVKVRGFRIELAEIEFWLRAVSGISDGAVIARPTRAGAHVLVAAVVSQAAAGVDAETIRRELSRSLPAYMVPDIVRSLPSLPLTPSGKLDRRALAELLFPRRPAAAPPPAEPKDITC
ncbi:amino acid adenylation domain-containing protein [Streptomyces sp. 2224.1]|uniref:amino acid adenylation domain-containing protein n=1 Tax=unclassified Streptomyces TaxID=2593676 RepID=UPI00088FE388|nr:MULTISPECIES: amino acid adenylation domain-containing protein [unclassified Streptomyces]PBC82466.1 amino acid adenylation domain-containing protein [Streptomyces sp. 2321.6]SDR49505.1 amino acid adenylation domain-containing protein [Streptomyces sp. KS_16]SEC45444.1 amino acid adenylation domain-containing protein [Streptomyces sp. 2224.1]SEC59040.1 amino acid adenylation domain-containing protein [Streptomyces sp. 2133.1]SEE97021.1 amino acid adenylation domain-containing protein [Strep